MEGELRIIPKYKLRKLLCKIGLHFLKYHDMYIGYRCYCRKNYLWDEHISDPNWKFK